MTSPNPFQKIKDEIIETFAKFYRGVYKDILPNPSIESGIEWHTKYLEQSLNTYRRAVIEEIDKKYEPLFKWLHGVKGDFPDLSERLYYKFRSKLSERIAAIKSELSDLK